jgi:hypothetical protein
MAGQVVITMAVGAVAILAIRTARAGTAASA